MWQILADGRLLTASRTRAYLTVLAAGMVLAVAHAWAGVLLSHWALVAAVSLNTHGKPAPTDFLGFWSAARLALQGLPQQAYVPAALWPLQTTAAYLDAHTYLGFFYPPIFLLACLPFGLLPYAAALPAFVVVTLAPLVVALRRLFPGLGWLPLIAFPAAMLNAVTGQTGFLTAAGFAGAAMFLQTRPILAGCSLGALACKPHFALCVPVALFAARRWRAAAAAAAMLAGLAACSWVLFGSATWQGFLDAAPLARDALEQDRGDWSKLFSVFAAVRLLQLGLHGAYAAQLLCAGVAMGLLAAAAWRRPGALPETAMLVAASVACTPHVLDYDLVCLLIPAGWMAVSARRTGWLAWEKTLLLLLYVVTLLGRTAAMDAGIPLGAAMVLAMLAGTARRALARA